MGCSEIVVNGQVKEVLKNVELLLLFSSDRRNAGEL